MLLRLVVGQAPAALRQLILLPARSAACFPLTLRWEGSGEGPAGTKNKVAGNSMHVGDHRSREPQVVAVICGLEAT